jgi:2-hydroxy-3-keto-5-methylthiopentenyl-1-phosphate phosphatase
VADSGSTRLAVISGFDGTIVTDDLTALVCDRFAVPSWRRWIEAAERREIPRTEALRLVWSSIRAPLAEVQVFVEDAAAVRAGFSDLLDLCIRRAIPVSIVTDAPDVVVRPVLPPRPGAFRLTCSSADFKRDGVRLHFPARDDRCATCGHCLGSLAVVLKAEGFRTVGVGSATSDRCLIGNVDVLFATRDLASEAASRRAPFRPFRSFRDVRNLLDAMGWDA